MVLEYRLRLGLLIIKLGEVDLYFRVIGIYFFGFFLGFDIEVIYLV